MKRLSTLKTATAALITMPLAMALAAALISTAVEAHTGSEPQHEELQFVTQPYEEGKYEPSSSDYWLWSAHQENKMAEAAFRNKDYARALLLYKRVASSGEPVASQKAQIILGNILLDGVGVDKNEAEAIRYYKMASDNWKNTTAIYLLGNIYNKKQNFTEAAKYYQLMSGDEFGGTAVNIARYQLGKFYADGNGVTQNFTTAAQYFKKAADLSEDFAGYGNADAQFALSALYGAGKGVGQSDAEALKYLRMAAKQDHTKAQFGLGMMFINGKGVTQSPPIGYLWVARAAEGDAAFRSSYGSAKEKMAMANGVRDAENIRDVIRAREGLTSEQLVKVQMVVDSCVASNSACNWGD
jgi:TPR repeat protein